MNFLNRFLYGRNGPDGLGSSCLVASVILMLLSRIPGLGLLYLLSAAALTYAIFRMISRNTSARRRENAAFMKVFGSVPRFFGKLPSRFKDMKVYKFFKCPGCKRELRVPRGKGRVKVRCPKCGFEFMSKT